MRETKIISFKITGMDGLGQGVCKESDKITFIPKSAPGDEGVAAIDAEKKGVAFGTVTSLSKSSPLRITPICPHFNDCPSCHYLHISYDQELKFKEESLQGLFRKLEIPKITVTPATRRLEYRNRIQLHFQKQNKKMGMLNARNQQIIPVPECMIAVGPVKEALKTLYANDSWISLAPTAEGHVEIYWLNNEIKINWNKPYADGGFTQVFDEMNLKMKSMIAEWNSPLKPSGLIDLFAGNGNLSEDLKFTRRLCVDYYTKNVKEDAISVDLYATGALSKIRKELSLRNITPTHMLLDPPRSGMKDLNQWVEVMQPEQLAYVSCDPNTLVRDISSLKGYQIKNLHLIDFFPSTYHYETLIILERKS